MSGLLLGIALGDLRRLDAQERGQQAVDFRRRGRASA